MTLARNIICTDQSFCKLLKSDLTHVAARNQMGLFGPPPTAKDVAKEQKKQLKTTTRDLDRDLASLKKDEAKLEAEIKAAAKKGDMAGARILAKQLAQMRQQQTKNMTMKSKVTSVGYSTQAMAQQVTMAKAVGSATRAMAVGNAQMKVGQMQAMSSAFERESAKMEISSSIFDDTLEGVFEGDEGAEDAVMSKIYDEIGLEFNASTPSTSGMQRSIGQHNSASQVDEDFEARLAKLANS